MNYRIVILVLLLILNAAHAARFALLVGNGSGGPDVSKLRYVKNDLTSLATILTDYCGFDKERIILLQDKSPDDLYSALANLRTQLPSSEDNLLLFYYTGHADQNYLKMGTDRFPLQSLKDNFTSFPASIRIGVFDACQSGSFTRLKGGSLSEPFLFKDDGKIKGQVILSSSSATENAQESDLLGNSVFTFHLVNALRGSADLSADRKVTLAEAYQYSYNHTVSSTAKSWGGTQHPGYQFQIQGEGDIVLADLNIRSLGILLQNGLSGDITIQDENGNIVADLSKVKTSAMMIALDPGTYFVYKSEDGKKWKSQVKVGPLSIVQLTETNFEKIAAQESRRKGTRPRYTSIGFGFTGGYRRIVMKNLDEQMSDRFSGYRMFGISPVFNYPYDAFSWGITSEVALRGRYLLSLAFTTADFKNNQTQSGKMANDINGTQSGVRLSIERSLSISILDIGAGYRISGGIARGLSFSAGLSIINVDHIIKSSFVDSLFDLTTHSEFKDKGTKLLPFVTAAYNYPLCCFALLGVQARYRYQNHAKQFQEFWPATFHSESLPDNTLSDEGFSYNLSGIEVSVHLLFTIRLREITK